MTWNTLDVPLNSAGKCTLIPARQYHNTMRHAYQDMSARSLYPNAGKRWHSRHEPAPSEYEQRRLWEEDTKNQLADDRKDFVRNFRLALDLRTITGGNALTAIQSFVRDTLNVAHWNYPTDNEGVQRMLCDAVASEKLIAVIDREYRGVPRVALPDPAPLQWPTTGGGGGYVFSHKVISYPEFVELQRTNRELANSSVGMLGAGLSAVVEPSSSLGTAASSGGGNRFDWLGAAETVGGAMLGGDDDSGDDIGALENAFSGGPRDDSTPSDHALPFEYTENAPGEFGEDTQTAWLPIDGGPPNKWVENSSGSRQLRYYDANGNAAVDFDFDHDHGFGIPHAHNWDNGVRDKGNSFSLLPW